MSRADHFVGRQDAVRRLAAVLSGRERAAGKLTVQSIEGPGGIGKTCLFDHVLTTTDMADQRYLILRLDGNEPTGRTVLRSVARLVDGAEAEAIRGKPPGYYFPAVARVTKAIEAIRAEAVAEIQKQRPNDDEGRAAVLRYLDLALATGKHLNDVLPITRRYVDVRALERDARLLEEVVPTLVSLREETARVWERLGIGSDTALRNALKENALRPLADALVSDLSAILAQYRPQDRGKAMHRKLPGIDRLLLILDDYEVLESTIGELLVGHLLPLLRAAGFESTVVILGRDQLEATHPAWDQHFKANLLRSILLDPLPRADMDQLVASYGVTSADETDRAWRDTQGYPFYVQLWIEEAESGGRGVVMLKRFHDRTTRWMGDREKRWLDQMIFLDEVNIRTLRAALEEPSEAEEAFRWFEREGSVRDTVGATFRVREYLRSRLVDYLRASDPDRCDALERRARGGGAARA